MAPIPFLSSLLANIIADTPPRTRTGARIMMAACALLFCVPFLLCLALDAGFLGLANEPLAYRFFYSERIFHGEIVVVGVGYLVSLVQHAAYAVLHLFPSVANSSLERRLDLFALTTNGILSAAVCAFLCIAARSAKLRITDLALLALVALMPIYGTVLIGFDYVLLADYHFLNIVLCIATLLLFQLIWRSGKPLTDAQSILIGMFVGMAAANKITMLVVTGVLLVPAIAATGGWRDWARRAILVLPAIPAAFLAVHWLSYLGRTEAMVAGLREWFKFVSNPGSEPWFWDNLLSGFIQGYNYGYFILYSTGIFMLVIASAVARRRASVQGVMVILYCIAGALACLFFIFKRPAGSTLFESTMFIFTLTAVLLTVASDWRVIRSTILASCIAWAAVAILTFQVSTTYGQIARSRTDSSIKWNAFNDTLRLAGSRPIEVIFPDNSYHHEGVFELLLKGAADFPGWVINRGQKSVLDRYAPGLTFRQNQGEIRPEHPYEGDRVLVWFDLPGEPPTPSKYPELEKILQRPGVIRIERPGYSHVTMRTAVLPGGPVALPKQK